jgi:2-oxoglutarate ferredoxin oxidoreductase subunit delta
MATTARGRRHVVSVNRDWCKGCGICVAFCPTKVLGMDGEEKAAVLRRDDCTGCRLCELRCPDFAIEVGAAGQGRVVVPAIAEADPEAERDARSGEDD